MVELRLQIRARFEDTAGLVDGLRSVMLPARLERGFVSNRLYQETDSPQSLCYIEEWDSLMHMNMQICSRRFSSLLALMETVPQPPLLEIRSISEVRGLEYVGMISLSSRKHHKPGGGGYVE